MKRIVASAFALLLLGTQASTSFAQTENFPAIDEKEVHMEIRSLNAKELSALKDGFALAAQLVESQPPLSVYQVQILYDALLINSKNDASHVIATGLAFGELIVHNSNMEWVRVSNEYGEETGLAPQGFQIFIAPISMIQKRIERNEHLSIATLRDDTIKIVNEQIATGEPSKRK